MNLLRRLASRLYAATRTLESGTPLALVRIFVGFSLIVEFVPFALTNTGHDVLRFAFCDAAHGGFRPNAEGSWLASFVPGTFPVILGLAVSALALAIALLVGLRGRAAALALMLVTAALHGQNPEVSGGSDVLLGNLLFLLALGDSSRTLSMDSWLAHRSIFDPTRIAAWPRRLLLVQLVVMYTSTGLQKLISTAWLPVDDFSALYQILQSPHWARFPHLPETVGTWLIPIAALGSATTILWEVTFSICLLHRKLRWAYAFVGILLHVGIELTMEVGLFSFFSLAFYPALLSKESIRLVERIRAWRPRPVPTTPPLSEV